VELYACLSVGDDASQEAIDAAYKDKISRLPTGGLRGWIVRLFGFSQSVEYAYRILGTPETRRRYHESPESYRGATAWYLGF